MRIEATVRLAIRPVRTLIALGIKPSVSLKTSLDPRVVLMMCTASNRSGIKFNLSSNIRRIDDRFLNRGKCTIELINPVKTIFISEADPLLLKLLLRTLRKVLSAKTNDELDKMSLTHYSLKPASPAQVYNLKEKMTISDKKSYPMKENFPSKSSEFMRCFPTNLMELSVNEINLKKIDCRMLKLNRLVKLDLSSNNIAVWPESFKDLVNLKELNLANNKLAEVPMSFFKSVSKKLCLLDLSNNLVRVVPRLISKLVNLVTLKLKNNQLRKLPVSIRSLKNLKYLDLIGNPDLGIMPASFLTFKLDHLSLSSQCFTSDASSVIIEDSTSKAPTLTDLSLATLSESGFRSKISNSFDEICLPLELLECLDTIQHCSCGKVCFPSSSIRALIKTDPKFITHNFTSDSYWLNWSAGMGSIAYLTCETLFCSKKCIELYRNQPLNYQ